MDNYSEANDRVIKALQAMEDASGWLEEAQDNCEDKKWADWLLEVNTMVQDLASDIGVGMKHWKEECA